MGLDGRAAVLHQHLRAEDRAILSPPSARRGLGDPREDLRRPPPPQRAIRGRAAIRPAAPAVRFPDQALRLAPSRNPRSQTAALRPATARAGDAVCRRVGRAAAAGGGGGCVCEQGWGWVGRTLMERTFPLPLAACSAVCPSCGRARVSRAGAEGSEWCEAFHYGEEREGRSACATDLFAL